MLLCLVGWFGWCWLFLSPTFRSSQHTTSLSGCTPPCASSGDHHRRSFATFTRIEEWESVFAALFGPPGWLYSEVLPLSYNSPNAVEA